MSYTIVLKEKPAQQDIVAVATPLQESNLQVGSPPGYLPVVLQLLDAEGNVGGGLFGQIAYDWLHIEYLVVPKALRGTGIGTELMRQAEGIAAEHSCVGVYLDTLSFQARPFYEKLGYTIFGQLDDRHRAGGRIIS